MCIDCNLHYIVYLFVRENSESSTGDDRNGKTGANPDSADGDGVYRIQYTNWALRRKLTQSTGPAGWNTIPREQCPLVCIVSIYIYIGENSIFDDIPISEDIRPFGGRCAAKWQFNRFNCNNTDKYIWWIDPADAAPDNIVDCNLLYLDFIWIFGWFWIFLGNYWCQLHEPIQTHENVSHFVRIVFDGTHNAVLLKIRNLNIALTSWLCFI